LKIGGSPTQPPKNPGISSFSLYSHHRIRATLRFGSRGASLSYIRGVCSYYTFSAPKWSQVRNIRLSDTEFRLVVDTKGSLDRFGVRFGIRCGWSSLSRSANARTRRRTRLVAADDSLFLRHAFGVSLSLSLSSGVSYNLLWLGCSRVAASGENIRLELLYYRLIWNSFEQVRCTAPVCLCVCFMFFFFFGGVDFASSTRALGVLVCFSVFFLMDGRSSVRKQATWNCATSRPEVFLEKSSTAAAKHDICGRKIG
jgi:hypothetical protein